MPDLKFDDVTLDCIKSELEQCIKSLLVGTGNPFGIADYQLKMMGEAKAYRKLLASAGYSIDIDIILEKEKTENGVPGEAPAEPIEE